MHKITNEKFQETYYIRTLNSGLRVVAMPKIPSYTTHVSMMFPFGARNLQYQINDEIVTLPEGVQHFFEHKIFASKKGDMFTKFVSFGLDANAMTGYESTSYVFSATNNLYEGLDLLFETVDVTYFTDENVEKEKDIINEEIQMNNDRLYTKMFRQLRKNMYHNHPIKTDILGTKESIQQINKDILKRIHDTFYQDHQRLLLISGNIDVTRLNTYLDQLEIREKTYLYPKYVYTPEPKHVVKAYEEVTMPIAHQTLMLGIKLKKMQAGIQYESQFLAIHMIMHGIFGPNTDFHQELIERRLIKKELSNYVERLKDAEAVILYAETSEPHQLIEAIKKQLHKPLETLVNLETFQRFKRMSLSNEIELLDNQEHKIDLFAQYLVEDLDLFDVLEANQALTFDDLIQTHQMILESDLTTLIINPAKNLD